MIEGTTLGRERARRSRNRLASVWLRAAAALLVSLALIGCDGEKPSPSASKWRSVREPKRLVGKGEYAAALKLLKATLKKRPNNAAALYLSGVAYYELNKSEAGTGKPALEPLAKASQHE